MVRKFVAIRPRHDIVTSYLYDFSKELIKTVKTTSDIHVTNLEDINAIRSNFESTLKKDKPTFVFLNGHGNKKSICGHNNEIILDKNNINLTKNKIVYAISCDALEELGPLAIKNDAKAFIGYKASFMLVTDPSRTNSPHKDNNALPFRKACCTLINSMVFARNTVEQSIELTKKEYRHAIRSYGTNEDDPYGDAPLIRFALAWNLEFLDMEGDPNAHF